jgi:CRISPR-associated protein Cas2
MSGRLRHLLVAYDVETVTPDGRRRLRKVAQLCCAHGVRVQKSVFECVLEIPEVVRFIDRLVHTIDGRSDSLRIYHLGAAPPRAEIHGTDVTLSPREPLII